jgi:hypothetical protein
VWQDNPVATAREITARDYWMPWPAPLVRWLRARSPNLALDWVFGVVSELLPRTGSPHAAELLGELEQLRRWRSAPPASDVFRQKAEELWYRPDRDIARTSMNRLCWSVMEFMCPDKEIGINWLWLVPSLLCQAGFDGGPRPELVEWCLSDFERFAAGVAEQDAARGT